MSTFPKHFQNRADYKTVTMISTDCSHETKFTGHERNSSACDNSCFVLCGSCGALRSLKKYHKSTRDICHFCHLVWSNLGKQVSNLFCAEIVIFILSSGKEERLRRENENGFTCYSVTHWILALRLWIIHERLKVKLQHHIRWKNSDVLSCPSL